MQDRIEEQFDLLVRSKMSQAEEKAPRRVWASVRRTLGGASRVPAVLWRGLAAVGVAAAALALVLTVGPASLKKTAPATAPVLAQAVSQEGGTQSSPEAVRQDLQATSVQTPVTTAAKAGSPARLLAQALPSGEETLMPEPDARETSADAAAEASAPAGVAAEADPAPSAGVAAGTARPSSEAPAASAQDIFSLMDAQDAARKTRPHRTALLFGGQMGTNDNASAGFSRVRLAAPSRGVEEIKTISEAGESTFDIPLSAGIGIKAYFAPRWAVGTGLTFTRLSRTFDGVYTQTNALGVATNVIKGDFTNTQLYLGVPVTVSYDIISNDAVSVYGFAGGAVERAVKNVFRIPGASSLDGDISGVQTSASAGLGLGFKLTGRLSLYVDPSVVYYFDCNQPKSIRTQQSLQGRFEAGLRFDLGR